MWNGSSAEEKQPYEKKAAKLKEKYDKVSGFKSGDHVTFWVSFIINAEKCCNKKKIILSPQDIVAYRTKGRVDSEPAAAANDDDDEEEGDEEEEEEEEDDE